MKIITILGLLLTMAIACGNDGCTDSDSQQREQQEKLNLQSNMEVGMPAIVNFQEKRMLKMIMELRDTEIKTITYTQDMNGKLHKLCDSLGFGVPYATQYTNPSRVNSSGHTVPQADPNGLFSPPGAEGTWVLCYNNETRKPSPVYVEPRIIVSPFHLTE